MGSPKHFGPPEWISSLFSFLTLKDCDIHKKHSAFLSFAHYEDSDLNLISTCVAYFNNGNPLLFVRDSDTLFFS